MNTSPAAAPSHTAANPTPGLISAFELLDSYFGSHIPPSLSCSPSAHSSPDSEPQPPLDPTISADTAGQQPQRLAPHPGGRPSTCTPENVELICVGIAEGRSQTAAAELVGIPASTLSGWKREHPEILIPFAAARERFRSSLLQKLHSAKTRDGRDDWRAAAWLLERSFPEDYGRKAQSHSSSVDEASAPPAANWNDYPDPDRDLPPRDRWTPFLAERRRQEAELAAREAELTFEAQIPGVPTSETSETPQPVTRPVVPNSTRPEPQSSETSETRPIPSSSAESAPEAPTSKTSETDLQAPDSASHQTAPNRSETSETPSSAFGESPELEPEGHQEFVDSLHAQSGLSRRERRRRAHLQRKAQTAQQRAASKTAPLAAAA